MELPGNGNEVVTDPIIDLLIDLRRERRCWADISSNERASARNRRTESNRQEVESWGQSEGLLPARIENRVQQPLGQLPLPFPFRFLDPLQRQNRRKADIVILVVKQLAERQDSGTANSADALQRQNRRKADIRILALEQLDERRERGYGSRADTFQSPSRLTANTNAVVLQLQGQVFNCLQDIPLWVRAR